MEVVTGTKELAAACERLSRHPFVTVDTEFLRETTYWPRLCLIQVATDDEAVLIDPLAPGIDLAPFFGLMADELSPVLEGFWYTIRLSVIGGCSPSNSCW